MGLAYRGRQLRRFHGPNGEIEMLLGLPEDDRPGLNSLNDLVIPRGDGTTVPIESVLYRSAPKSSDLISPVIVLPLTRRTASVLAAMDATGIDISKAIANKLLGNLIIRRNSLSHARKTKLFRIEAVAVQFALPFLSIHYTGQ